MNFKKISLIGILDQIPVFQLKHNKHIYLYLMEVPSIKHSENRQETIETFTKKYADHGFPITQEICRSLNFNFTFEFNDDEIENLIYDIHDLALDLMEENNIEAIILTQNNGYVAFYDSEDEEELKE